MSQSLLVDVLVLHNPSSALSVLNVKHTIKGLVGKVGEMEKHFLSYPGFGLERGIVDLLLTDDGDRFLIIQ